MLIIYKYLTHRIMWIVVFYKIFISRHMKIDQIGNLIINNTKIPLFNFLTHLVKLLYYYTFLKMLLGMIKKTIRK
jgi:hypothetical protein